MFVLQGVLTSKVDFKTFIMKAPKPTNWHLILTRDASGFFLISVLS